MKYPRFLLFAMISVVMLMAIAGVAAGVARTARAAAICSPATTISVPFAQDGVGDFCWQTTGSCGGSINSWNLTTLEVNGTAYINTYAYLSSIAPVNGMYIIHYVSASAYGHFEIDGGCISGTPTTGPTSTPLPGASRTRTPTAGPSVTLTRTPTTGPTFTRTRTPTTGPSVTLTRTPTTGPTFTPTRTPTQGTIVPTLTPSPGASPTRTPTPYVDSHIANPFIGAVGYLNPDYTAQVNAAAAATGGSLGTQMAKVANYSTAIWLDSIAAVNGGTGYSRSLAGHLDAALAQNANLITIVLYDIPNRNCAARISDGELLFAANGLSRYKTEFIDVIAATLSKPAYANLRIIAIIEPDSLYNLVASLSTTSSCQEAGAPGGYAEAIQYALNRLKPLPNVYNYLDIGNSGIPGGWDAVFAPAVTLYATTIKGTVAGTHSVDGFITNTANYAVTGEPFMTANQTVGGVPVYSAMFYGWNPYIDETSFAFAWKNAMITNGFSTYNVNMLIDTSRNGWGGSSYGRSRPTGPSTSTDLETFVNGTRVDRRYDKTWWGWCNQASGIGSVPQANPTGGVFQAYLWVKAPGISDGSSSLIPLGPQNPLGKGFNQMCDPAFVDNSRSSPPPTGAMPNAPAAGLWFQDAFVMLVTNAYPPLP